jgi:7-cyano-7-deazaguanine reductase
MTMSEEEDIAFENALKELRKLDLEDRRRAFQVLKKERLEEENNHQSDLSLLPNSHWSQAKLLNRLPNPTSSGYEQKIYIPELTFVGTAKQPDFGEILITFYPLDWTIELKSLKQYKDSFRDVVASYERLSNVIFEDLMEVYDPIRLRLMVRLRPRGGISSCLTIDSDWKIRGGKESFSDWQNNTDRFGFELAGTTRL